MRVANFETGSFSEFSSIGTSNGTLVVDSTRASAGNRSAKATYSGAGANGYARGIWDVSYPDGATIHYGASFFLPNGFKSAMQGQVSLIRCDNWPTYQSNGDIFGVALYGADKRARLKVGTYSGGDRTLIGPFDLPEDQWFTLEVRQKLSKVPGTANSEVYVNSTRVGSSTAANSGGRRIERVRVGIVAIDAGSQIKPLTLWFDQAFEGTGPAPAPTPTPTTKPCPTCKGTGKVPA